MKLGQKVIFNDRNVLEDMIKLRRGGLAISSLSFVFGVDVTTIRWHLRRYYIPHPQYVYSIERIISKIVPPDEPPKTYKVIKGERINIGKGYKEYLAELEGKMKRQ